MKASMAAKTKQMEDNIEKITMGEKACVFARRVTRYKSLEPWPEACLSSASCIKHQCSRLVDS